MQKILLTIAAFTFLFLGANAQEKVTIYNPKADAGQDIAAAVAKAKLENKHVFIQVGGNWCIWCIRFHHLVDSVAEVKDYLNQNYVRVLVNYSTENKNKAIMAQLKYPQRFGFPVFVILDSKGEVIHTQNSGDLEDGKKGHDAKKVLEFLKQWSPSALDPKNYD